MNARQDADLNKPARIEMLSDGLITVKGLVQANNPIWTANANFTAAFDHDTHAPLEGVNAGFVGYGLKKETTAKGQFWVQNLPEGSYILLLTRPGYQPKNVNFVVVDEITTKLTEDKEKVV